MTKEQMLELLGPFIRGEIEKEPKHQRAWHKAVREVSSKIPNEELEEAIKILEPMVNQEWIEGAHGVLLSLLVRRLDLQEHKRERRR